MSYKEYLFSSLEAFLINKRMPKGYKLESVDNLNSKIIQQLNNSNNSNIRKIKNTESTQKKCENCLKNLIDIKDFKIFYSRDNLNEPSLMKIEKNVKMNLYKAFNDFIIDIKKLYIYYFLKYHNNSENLNKIKYFKEQSQNLFKEYDINYINTEIAEDLLIYNKNDRPLNNEEKTNLTNNIKLLNKVQLQGIIKILQSRINYERKEQFFTFDINDLQPYQCWQIDNYTKICLENKYIYPKINNNSNNNNNDQCNNRIINNDMNKPTINKTSNNNKKINDYEISESDSNSGSESW